MVNAQDTATAHAYLSVIEAFLAKLSLGSYPDPLTGNMTQFTPSQIAQLQANIAAQVLNLKTFIAALS